MRYNFVAKKPTERGWPPSTDRKSSASFYDKLFASLDFELPRDKAERTDFPKEAMLCAVIVIKCEGFGYITDLWDYLDNNRL